MERVRVAFLCRSIDLKQEKKKDPSTPSELRGREDRCREDQVWVGWGGREEEGKQRREEGWKQRSSAYKSFLPLSPY